MTRAITKHNYLVLDINDLPRALKEAFYLARCVMLIATTAPQSHA